MKISIDRIVTDPAAFDRGVDGSVAARAMGIGTVLLLVAIGLGGCLNSPEKVEQYLEKTKPAALAAAKDRAQTDLACGQVTANVLSEDAGDTQRVYSLRRAVYTVETRGCGRRTEYTVACSDEGVCSALAERAIIERGQ
jgi:hypothetical protein